MTLDKVWVSNPTLDAAIKTLCLSVWDEATRFERERCAKIIESCRDVDYETRTGIADEIRKGPK